jgi:hypothetical protein
MFISPMICFEIKTEENLNLRIHKLGMMVHAYNLSYSGGKARELRVQGHSGQTLSQKKII